MENSETEIIPLSQYDSSTKYINLPKDDRNDLRTEFLTRHLLIKLKEDQDCCKQLYNILPGSCFESVEIYSSSVNFIFFNCCLKNYCHVFDVLDFQEKIMNVIIDQVTFEPIDLGLLSDFHKLHGLHLTINELDFENVKIRLMKLAQRFKQANFQNLNNFVLNEKSSLGYAKDFIPAWIDLLAAIP